jgi:hypothetical protein
LFIVIKRGMKVIKEHKSCGGVTHHRIYQVRPTRAC